MFINKLLFFRLIVCVKSFVPLGSQNGLSGADHLQSPKAWHPFVFEISKVSRDQSSRDRSRRMLLLFETNKV